MTCFASCAAMRPRIPSVDFWNQQLSARFCARVKLFRLFDGHLQVRILHLLGSLDNRLHRIRIDLAAIFVEHSAQVFLRLVVFARRHHNGVFNRAHHNLRINAFFPADPFDDVVKLTSHKNSRFQCFKVARFQSFNCKAWR